MKPGKLFPRLGVVAAIGFLVAGLALPQYNPVLHGLSMLLGAVTLLVAGVGAAYALSVPRASSVAVVSASAGVVIAIPSSVLVVVSLGDPLYAVPLAVGLAFLGLASLDSGSRARRGTTTRWSLLGLSYSFLFSATILPIALHIAPTVFHAMLSYALALPVQAIYSVTLHALPSTYRGKPSRLVALAYPAASAAAVTAMGGCPISTSLLAVLSLWLFIAFSGFTLVPHALRSVDASTVAGKTHRYFLQGHLYAVAAAVASTAAFIGYGLGYVSVLAPLHVLLAGFTAVFVSIHAPLMLPVILSTSTARRYNQSPFLLALASSILWLFQPGLALYTFAAWALSLLLVVKPARRLRRG